MLVSLASSAKVPEVTLDELISGSELIVKGTIKSCRPRNGKQVCSIAEAVILKGPTSGAIEVCNDDASTEEPKLKKILGHELILFLRKDPSCWYIFNQYRGLIRIEGEYGFPGVISDLPEKMPAANLEDAIRKRAEPDPAKP